MAYLDIKRQARRDLHSNAQVPAYYVRAPGAQAQPIGVRVHNVWNQIGDIKGSRTYPGETENVDPKIVFNPAVDGCIVQRGAYVSISATEAYLVDHAFPPDDEFQSARVTRVSVADIPGLNLPVPS